MPNHKSAWKRIRQNAVRRARNKGERTSLRRVIKTFREIDDPAVALERMPGVASVIDTAAKKGIIHHRQAARLKSRLAKRIAGSS